MTPRHIIGLSGGKDSTAMGLALAEFEPREYEFICTPTGDELPEMVAHWAKLEKLLGAPLRRVTAGVTLDELIEQQQMLPNFRARWCTRILKIEPTIEYMKALPPQSVMYVGLRADEPDRQGIFGEDLVLDFPLRRWGWKESDVWGYLKYRGVTIPNRTDCGKCYGQRLGEWYALWHNHSDRFKDAEALENKHQHTFRSETRDTWPAALTGLRARFERGDIPRGSEAALRENGECRVCRL